MRRTKDQALVPATFVALNRGKAVEVMAAMADLNTSQARVIFAKVAGAWGYNTEARDFATVPLTDDEKSVIGERVANVVRLPRYVARYRCDKNHALEVVVRTDDVPAKRRTLRTARGKARFTLAEVHDRNKTHKESITMAARNTRTKAKAKKAKVAEPEEDLDDELEGLEELEEIEDIEDEDEELEIEDEDEEDEDEEEEEPAPKAKKGKAKGTKNGKASKASAKRAKAKKAPEPEPDEDDEEDEEPAPRKKAKSKASSKSAKSNGKAKAKKKQAPPATRELPAGRLSAADVAEMAGTDARAMRVFLRANEDRFPKDEDLGRYSFTKTQAKQLAKAFKTEWGK